MLTLAELAFLTDAPPKWVLNTCAALGLDEPYSLGLAKHLYLTRRLHLGLAVPLPRAYELAVAALSAPRCQQATPVRLAAALGADICLEIDRERIESSFAIRRSALATTSAPRARGRPAARDRDPVAAAEAWGLDLSLLRANLRRTPCERLRQLDAMMGFRRRVRRTAVLTGSR